MIVKFFCVAGAVVGLSSCLSIFWLNVFNTFPPIIIEASVLMTLGLLVFRNLHLQIPKTQGPRLFDLFFFGGIFCFAVQFFFSVLRLPHGNWDAWAIWNLRARFLFRGAEHWRDMFSPVFEGRHSDYPLLLPALIANSWRYLGKETVFVPIFWSLFFAAGIAVFLFAGLSATRCTSQARIATSILLATPFFAQHAASQYADIPLSFYLIGGIVFITIGLNDRKNAELFLGGLFYGFAAWTKDEGILFGFSILLARFILKRQFLFRRTAILIGSMLPGLLAALVLKLQVQNLNHYSASDVTVHLLNASRYITVIVALLKQSIAFGGGLFFVPILLIAYLFAVGVRPNRHLDPEKLTLITLVLTISGYVLIYVTTPHPLAWQLSTSLDRLLLQLWPAFLFLFFQVVRTPEEIRISIPDQLARV